MTTSEDEGDLLSGMTDPEDAATPGAGTEGGAEDADNVYDLQSTVKRSTSEDRPIQYDDGRYLLACHFNMLTNESGIDPEVVRERGYHSLDVRYERNRKTLLGKHSIPIWGVNENYMDTGLVIPINRLVPKTQPLVQWRPDRKAEYTDKETGEVKQRRYVNPAGQPNVLDVHPRNRSNLGFGRFIKDLWITEGTKKADALTSHGLCAIAISGVENWRGKHGPLGDWECIYLDGRDVYICFDSDTYCKPAVASAMRALGAFLTARGAKVRYIVVPLIGGAA